MDPVVIDSVTADTLAEGDLIAFKNDPKNGFFCISEFIDATHVIYVSTEEGEWFEFEPDAKVDLFSYPAVEI